VQPAPQPGAAATRLAERVGGPDERRNRDGHPRAEGGLPDGATPTVSARGEAPR
jgi:hypothetical protein